MNINVNVITTSRIIFEFGPTGAVAGSVESNSARIFYFTPSTSGGAEVSVYVLQLFLFFAFAVDGVDANLLVVLLEGSQVLAGLGELAFFHTFSDIPVHKGSLGIHKIELVVEASPGFGDGGGVGQHADGTLDLREITTRDDGRGLVVDADLESSGAPVDKLNGALGLDGGNGGVDVLGDDITTVKHAAGHVFAVARVTLDHLVGRFEAGVGDFCNRQLLVVSLLGRDDRGVRNERKVNTRVRDEVGLELCEIHVEGTIEAEGRGDGRHNLTDETVKVGVRRAFNVEVATANVIDGLVVDHEGTVGVLEGGVGGEDRVVRLDHGRRHLRGGVNRKLKLGLFAIVDGQALHQEGGETRAGTTTERVEEEKALETSALVGELAGPVKNEVDNFLADGVVSTGVVVGGVFLTGDELFWVEELTVGSGADLIDNSRLEIDKDATGNVLAGTGFGEEGVERVVTATNGLVRGHLTVRLDAVLEAVELPAGITRLDTGLADVDRDALTHVEEWVDFTTAT